MGLPVIFVCEDNLYSVYTGPDERKSREFDLQLVASGVGRIF